MSKASKSSSTRARRMTWFDRFRGLFARRAAPATVRGAAGQKAGPGAARARKGGAPDAAHMLKVLRGVLDRHAQSRSVLAHLSVVEQALEHRGVAALEDVPADVIARALSQLEMLVADWSEGGIAALRAQLKAAMAKPGRLDLPRQAAPARQANEFDNSRLQVHEASVSTFMEARARWETSLTGGR